MPKYLSTVFFNSAVLKSPAEKHSLAVLSHGHERGISCDRSATHEATLQQSERGKPHPQFPKLQHLVAAKLQGNPGGLHAQYLAPVQKEGVGIRTENCTEHLLTPMRGFFAHEAVQAQQTSPQGFIVPSTNAMHACWMRRATARNRECGHQSRERQIRLVNSCHWTQGTMCSRFEKETRALSSETAALYSPKTKQPT
jgi:hypothetical protein